MSELSTARKEKWKKDEAFRNARQRCLEATVRSLNSGCSEHFTYEYDRRKFRGDDRRRFQSGDEAPRRRVSGETGRRVGDLPWPRLPFAPKPIADRRKDGVADRRMVQTHNRAVTVRRFRNTGRRSTDVVAFHDLPFASSRPVVAAITPEPKRSIKDRRASHRRQSYGPRREGPADRRVVRTHGSPAIRNGLGRRAGDKSYIFLPWAPLPAVKPKPSLRDRVAELPGGTVVSREKVLDLLREYGMGDH